MPRVINVNKNPAFPLAVEALKEEGILPRRVRLRQCQYLNRWVAKGDSIAQATFIAELFGIAA